MTGTDIGPDERPAGPGQSEAELSESAGLQNSVAVAGPAALLLVPLAWGLAELKAIIVRLRG